MREESESGTKADAWRRRNLSESALGDAPARFKTALQHLCKSFLSRLGGAFWAQLADCDATARQGNLTPEELLRTFDLVCKDLAEEYQAENAGARQFLRPILLELQARLADAVEPPKPWIAEQNSGIR